MVPLEDPDVNPTEMFTLEFAADETWPVTVNVVPVEPIAGKHEPEGLFTAVTVPLRTFPVWLKLIVRLVVGVLLAPGANIAFQFPVMVGV
jgi:hypothetical protein